MLNEGTTIEVQGVPDVLPAETTVDKLHIHFLRAKHGGGEVLRVLYPCYLPGQAFITFEEPEVAARVLQTSPHVLELNRQKYVLTVKAADHLEMDFPVEATVHLNIFPNETQVRKILRSQGFELTDLSGDRVRVKGSFLRLRAVKASLEQLLPSSSSPVPDASSGAISKYYANNSSEGSRSRLGSRHKPPHASSSSPTNSSSWVSSSSNNHPTSPRPDQRGSPGAGNESFVVDADVFEYAERLRKRDIDGICYGHNVTMEVHQDGDSCNITLQGKRARAAVGKLQSLLNDLSTSLRTQEVSLKDMDHEGKAFFERIQRNRNIYNSVLVCLKNDQLHLIGPSGESYEVKQRLLGRSVYQSGRPGRTGQTLDKNPRRRSSSLPPTNRKNTERDSGVATESSPVGAAGYSPSKYRDDKQDDAEREAAAHSEFFRRRSNSELREETQAEKTKGNVQDMENKHAPPKISKKGITHLLQFSPKDMKKTIKNLKKKK